MTATSKPAQALFTFLCFYGVLSVSGRNYAVLKLLHSEAVFKHV